MLIYLFSLLFIFILNGPEQLYMVPDLKKDIKKHVEDKERKEMLLDNLKKGRKEIKAFIKEQEKLAKEVKQEINKVAGNPEYIQQLFDSALTLRQVHQKAFIEGRLRFQESLDQEEWNTIVKKAAFPSDKNKAKNEKYRQKTQQAYKDYLDKLKTTIEEAIENEQNEAEALQAHERFRLQHEKLIKMRNTLDYENQKILRNKNVSKAELETFYAQQDTIRQTTYNAFVDLFSTLQCNSDKKEWKKIKKSLRNIFKER